MSWNEPIGCVKLTPVNVAQFSSYVSVQLLVQGLHRQPKLFYVLFESVGFVFFQPIRPTIRITFVKIQK